MSTTPQSPKNILVIDDNRFILSLVKYALRQTPYNVLTCESGQHGMRVTHKIHPDLVILDQHLGDTQGTIVLHDIKTSPDTHKIPVLMLTCEDDFSQIMRIISSGADDYVLKPFKKQNLVDRVDDLIIGRRMRNKPTHSFYYVR